MPIQRKADGIMSGVRVGRLIAWPLCGPRQISGEYGPAGVAHLSGEIGKPLPTPPVPSLTSACHPRTRRRRAPSPDDERLPPRPLCSEVPRRAIVVRKLEANPVKIGTLAVLSAKAPDSLRVDGNRPARQQVGPSRQPLFEELPVVSLRGRHLDGRDMDASLPCRALSSYRPACGNANRTSQSRSPQWRPPLTATTCTAVRRSPGFKGRGTMTELPALVRVSRCSTKPPPSLIHSTASVATQAGCVVDHVITVRSGSPIRSGTSQRTAPASAIHPDGAREHRHAEKTMQGWGAAPSFSTGTSGPISSRRGCSLARVMLA